MRDYFARRRRARWMAKQLRALDKLDARHLRSTPYRDSPPRRTFGPALVGVGLVVVMLAASFVLSPDPQIARLRAMVGIHRPPSNDVPGAHYTFMQQQDVGGSPVGYDPCTPIRYEINPEQAPDDYLDYVETAVERISEASGLTFEYVGLTDSRNFDLVGYDGRFPVLVAWATEEEYDALAGNVAGVAGSAALEVLPGFQQLVTGRVVLDADTFGSWRRTRARLQPIVDHEFGHLVGLGHVEDPGEVMDGDNSSVDRFGPGDLAGLKRLGDLPCT